MEQQDSNNTLGYVITEDQAIKICEHFNKDINTLENYEISELLDKVIDNL